MRRSGSVVVTGMGAVSALGQGLEAHREALRSGRCGIGPIRRFDTRDFTVGTGAEIHDLEPEVGEDLESEAGRCGGLAIRAAGEALASAGVEGGSVAPHRVGLVFGTGLGDLDGPVHEVAQTVARRLGITGPVLTVGTACSSSTGAIGLGRDLVLDGSADVVLAGGADVLTPRVFAGFHALGVLSPEACAPFSHPFGTTLGEGAGFLVLEEATAARRRGGSAVVALPGYGLSADGFHETSPDPRGGGVERAIRWALADAGVQAGDVDYVNAHGSGTEANDPAEWSGIRRALEGRSTVPVSSSKGALGHAQGAAGALETVMTILALEERAVPPTLNFKGPRPFGPDDPIAGSRPRSASVQTAVCLNAAFGGANAALVLTRATRRSSSTAEPRPVFVVGLGLVGRHGLGVQAWDRSGASAARPDVPPFSLDAVDARLDPTGLDPSSRYLTAAAALALADAGGGRRGRTPRDAGLVLGAIRPSPASMSAFGRSIEERGLRQVSAPAFARIVLNAPAGACSKLLGLRGPHTTVTVGAGSGLAAIVLAARLLRDRPELKCMLGGAVDESGEDPEHRRPMPAGEGAACVVLGRTPGEGAIRVVSWGMAGPHRSDEAIARVWEGAGRRAGPVDRRTDESDFAGSESGGWALPSSLAFLAAVSDLRRGEARTALVTSDLGGSLSLAVLLEQQGAP